MKGRVSKKRQRRLDILKFEALIQCTGGEFGTSRWLWESGVFFFFL